MELWARLKGLARDGEGPRNEQELIIIQVVGGTGKARRRLEPGGYWATRVTGAQRWKNTGAAGHITPKQGERGSGEKFPDPFFISPWDFLLMLCNLSQAARKSPGTACIGGGGVRIAAFQAVRCVRGQLPRAQRKAARGGAWCVQARD